MKWESNPWANNIYKEHLYMAMINIYILFIFQIHFHKKKLMHYQF